MTLSNSRQQFLAYETQPEDIQYGRKGGIFVSTCVCVFYIILAVVIAGLVGIIVYFITYFKLSQKQPDFWNEADPFSQEGQPSANLRLPPHVVPSFYRLKLKADLDNATFSGEVYITIRASKSVKEIILHSKDLRINSNVKLTEQIYEKLDTLQVSSRSKRQAPTEETLNPNTETSTAPNNIQVPEKANKSTVENGNPIAEKENPVANTVDKVTLPLGNDSKTNTENITEVNNNKSASASSTLGTNVENNIDSVTTPLSVLEPSTVIIDVSTAKPITTVGTQVTHSSVRRINITAITTGPGDRLILSLASALKTDVDYTLELSFEGKISNTLTGFYMSTYTKNKQTRRLGVTQFEPTFARAAFPCFDEPAFKAKFEISIAHPINLSVLSNMKVAAQENIKDEPGWQWTHFERSVNMSTYLVAYTLSDFKSLETVYTSKDNVTKTIKVWCREELIGQAKYALNAAPTLLSFYEEVFGLPYALDKLDLIAIPDFSSGAMENWGLITFRETTLLFDESTAVPRDKLYVAIDIAHELAHQWFGNLVTMKWWTDLWLNEGFATYIEYIGVNHVEPGLNMLEKFTHDKMDLLRMDALKNTSPVSRRVIDASEISQKFDEISYSKGANLIRMLNHTLSEEMFHKGLVLYLNTWKYSNAEENDLWDAMAQATKTNPLLKDLSVVEFMNTWTKQAGYPVVKVVRDYKTNEVSFEQKLFSSSKDPYQKMLDQLWQIPISYTSMTEPQQEWTTKPKIWLKERETKTQIPLNETDALYVNVDAIGYYRVNYDIDNWQLLRTALKSGQLKSPVTKAQLIDDAFNLAKTSQLNYSYALGLTTCVIDGEDSRIVWELLLNNFAFLRFNLKATSGYVYLQDYVQMLLKTQLKRLNYGLDKPKDDNEAFLIENLLSWECTVESERCLKWAKGEFEKWMNEPDVNNNPIPSYLRSIVYGTALKFGGRREFDFLWNVFWNSTDPNVQSLIINTLPSTMEESLVTMLLEKSLTVLPKQYAIGAWNVNTQVGTRLAQNFICDHFDSVYDRFNEMDPFMFPAALNGAFGALTTVEELDKLKALALKHKDKLMSVSQSIQKLVDSANLKINWIKLHGTAITKWFKDYVEDANNNKDKQNLINATVESSVPQKPSIESSNGTRVQQDGASVPEVIQNAESNVAQNVTGDVHKQVTNPEESSSIDSKPSNSTTEVSNNNTSIPNTSP